MRNKDFRIETERAASKFNLEANERANTGKSLK